MDNREMKKSCADEKNIIISRMFTRACISVSPFVEARAHIQQLRIFRPNVGTLQHLCLFQALRGLLEFCFSFLSDTLFSSRCHKKNCTKVIRQLHMQWKPNYYIFASLSHSPHHRPCSSSSLFNKITLKVLIKCLNPKIKRCKNVFTIYVREVLAVVVFFFS